MTSSDHRDDTAIVVVNYGSHRLLDRHLGDAQPAGTRVVIVDNLQSAAERTAIAQLCAHRGWTLVTRPNDGFGAGVNAGVTRARELGCSTVILLNPDAVADAAAISALRERVHEHPDALISPWIVTSTGRTEFCGSRLFLRDGRIRGLDVGLPRTDLPRRLRDSPQVAWLSGACLAMRFEVFERLGGFDPAYFLYWEDVDLSYRATQLGIELVVVPEIRVVHDEGGTQGARSGRAKSSAYYRYNARNRLVFAARRMDRRTVVRWLLATPAVSWEILMRGGRRQLLQSPRPLIAVLRGSLEGVAVAARALVTGGRDGS